MTHFITQQIIGLKTKVSFVFEHKGKPKTLSAEATNGSLAMDKLNRMACRNGLAGEHFQVVDGMSGCFVQPKKRAARKKEPPADLLAEWGPYTP